MRDIDKYAPRSGRMLKEDNTVVNEADGINPDGSRRVVVTGSKVILLEDTNFISIPAGGYNVTSIYPILEYKSMDIGFYSEGYVSFPNKINFECLDSSNNKTDPGVAVVTSASRFATTKRIEAIGIKGRVVFYNDDTVSRTIKRQITGVK